MSRSFNQPIPRRRLLLGAGATAIGAGIIGAGGGVAEAAPTTPNSADGPKATPATPTIASAPLSGYTYRYASMFDFSPEDGTANRGWGGYGIYPRTTSTTFWASMDIPAGAKVLDIEWYVYNASASAVTGLGRLWGAGNGSLGTIVGDVNIAASTGIKASRVAVPSSNYGPFPTGSKLNLGLYVPSLSGQTQINGVRVGFGSGAGQLNVIGVPIRVYDTRTTHDPFGTNTVRTITLPAAQVVPGTSSVMIKVTTTGATAPGHLNIWPTGSATPVPSALNYGTADIGDTYVVGVTASRQITIKASSHTDVIIDLLGTIS